MPPGQLSVVKNVLKDVVALVDVKSSLGNPALAISSRLQSLGATVIRTLNASVTHVIFRNGSENILSTAKKAKNTLCLQLGLKHVKCIIKKQKSVKSSQGDLFSYGEISSDSENGASDMASVVTKSRRSPHSFSEVPPVRSSSDKAHVFTTGVIASTQNEAAPTNNMELTGNISPIHRTELLAENHTKQPELMICHPHRRLLPLDRGEQKLVEKLITPVGKPYSDTPTFPKLGRSTNLLFSKIGRLSSKAPLTADLLLEVQRHRATSSALARKNYSPRTNPHRMKKHSGRSVQSAVSRTAKKRVSFSSDVKFCSMKPLVKSKKAHNQLSTACSGKQTDEPHSTGNTALDTLIRTCAVQVDLDASGCPSTHSTPVSLRLPSPRDPNEKEHMTAEHRLSAHESKWKNRLKSPISVDSTSCPQSSCNKSSGSKQITTVSSQSVPVSTRRRSARLNPQPVVNQPNASGGIHVSYSFACIIVSNCYIFFASMTLKQLL
ncbi:putative Mitotic and DNA damage checkpoint protein hus1 [Fasciola gigantica]|uniref:Putative Mitotic and DNA damage checkpoint protein hus1 n=1 Tax=Fasciola gigantica TaxID=46835 RepID=A0A504YZ63_FASGI|nr:putative Mitotic and DNA damage checkpoint protein hus1 [Fasciola gigantica]